MDLHIEPERDRRRIEAREWLVANVPRHPLPSMDTPQGAVAHRAWDRKLADARWAVVAWPEQFGGRGYDLLDWLLFEEEYFAAGGPARITNNGLSLLGATLLDHGTDEQRHRILPGMVSGDTVWAQAWSEPGAGSDIASVSSRATRVDGGYLLSGQKIWSSRANVADRAFGLFRSDPESIRHRGLTYAMFPLRDASVTVRPIGRFDGDPVFAEIFLDECFVPDRDVIGTPGDGWTVVMATAAKERGVTLRSPGRFLATARDLVRLWRSLPHEAHARHGAAVARLWSRAEAYRISGFLSTEGRIGAEEASMGKLFWSELDLELHELAIALLDQRRQLGAGAQADAAEEEGWLAGYRFALAGPIYAGTNQIQKNIIAERLLGLPRA
ncbi:MAG: acyl-CoA dehydrogenase [Microbacteriaceae bacterium]|nr:acyl-CoA dehydrogenase [Microbacteriaceae bacterium]